MTEERDMTPYINTQLLLDRVDGRVISTVKLGSAHAAVHGYEYETTMFNTSRTQFIEGGPYYWKNEEEARRGHEMIKNRDSLQEFLLMGAHY